jgi:uncharacterized protein DUF1573
MAMKKWQALIWRHRFATMFLVVLGLCVVLFGQFESRKAIPDEMTNNGRQDLAPSTRPSRFVHDFGIVKESSRLVHEFTVRNESPFSWTPLDVKTSCACTGAVLSKDSVKPGKQLVLRLAYKAPQAEGVDRQRAFVALKEHEMLPLLFEIKATIVHDLSVFPSNLAMGALTRGKSTTGIVEVLNNSDRVWEGISVLADVPWLKCENQAASPSPSQQGAKQRWLVPVSVSSGDLKSGKNHGSLIIKAISKDTDVEAKSVAVDVTIAPEFQIIPEEVFLGEVLSNETRSFSLMIRFSPDAFPKDLSVVKVSHNLGKALTYKTRADPSSSVLFIKCRLDGKALIPNSDAYANGLIHLKIGNSEGGNIDVPLLAKVSS